MSKLARLAVFVSLDGTESIHDRIRGSGTFAKANDALRMLINAGVSADVLFTLNALNAQCYREVLDYCRELGVTCNFNLFKPFRRKQGGLVISPTRFFEIALDLFELRQRGSYAIGIANAAIVSKLLGGPVRNECRACEAGLVITAFGKMVTCPALVEAGYYHAEDLPEFDANFLQTWKSHRIFAEFRGNGLRGCQLRSVIFCKNPKRPDPYGIEAFTNFLDKKFPGDSIRATSYSAPNRERSRSFSE
jgi:MoaA/NifB/PqqE/SkfB family radical SAM enzyme